MQLALRRRDPRCGACNSARGMPGKGAFKLYVASTACVTHALDAPLRPAIPLPEFACRRWMPTFERELHRAGPRWTSVRDDRICADLAAGALGAGRRCAAHARPARAHPHAGRRGGARGRS